MEPEEYGEPHQEQEAFQFIRENLDKATSRQKRYYDKFRRKYIFRVGDFVLRETHVLSNAAKRFTAKLVPKREGPYEIVAMVSENVALLKEPNSDVELGTVHICQLTPYHPPLILGIPPPPPRKSKRGRPPGGNRYNLCKQPRLQE